MSVFRRIRVCLDARSTIATGPANPIASAPASNRGQRQPAAVRRDLWNRVQLPFLRSSSTSEGEWLSDKPFNSPAPGKSNLRALERGASAELVEFYGSSFRFAKTKEARIAEHDSRLSIAERYTNREGYVKHANIAASDLIKRRFVLPRVTNRW